MYMDLNDTYRRYAHIYPTPNNSHDIVVLSPDAFNEVLKIQDFRQTIPYWLKNDWQTLKDKLESMASYSANANDLRTAVLLGAEVGVTGRVYIKTYGGKPHIVLKGNQRLRTILNATRYSIRHTTVINMGLGVAGASAAAKSGGFLTIMLLSAFRVANYVLTDSSTLGQLIGSLATDVVKVGIAVGASIAFATAMGASSLAIGPIVVVLLVGTVISFLLTQVDDKYQFTKRLNEAIDEYVEDPKRKITESVFQHKLREPEPIYEFKLLTL